MEEDIGIKLKKTRKKMLFSQKLMAEYLEIDKNVLNNYENGKENPPIDILEKVSDLLLYDFFDFLNDDIEKILSSVPVLDIHHDYSVADLKAIASINKISLNLNEMLEVLDK